MAVQHFVDADFFLSSTTLSSDFAYLLLSGKIAGFVMIVPMIGKLVFQGVHVGYIYTSSTH